MRNDLKLSISFAWWLKPYIHVLMICAALSGREPDQQKLLAKMKRATRVSVR